MTCFWDGILSKITLDDINNKLTNTSLTTYVAIDNKEFINLLKKSVSFISNYNVTITDKSGTYVISPKLREEIVEWILEYNIDGIGNGHDCSICDPFLIIIAHIFQIHIKHIYNSHLIEYKNTENITREISFSSDQGHFS